MDRRERAIAQRLSQEVRRARTERGWSQAHLAELLDVSVNYVSLLERAERLPSVDMLVRLASELGVSISVLVGETKATEQTWAGEAFALLDAVPEDAREVVLAMLRGLSAVPCARPQRRSRR